jgi:hypothetical protein
MLGTERVKRRQIPAAHRDELRREPAMPVDPGADFRGIEPRITNRVPGTTDRGQRDEAAKAFAQPPTKVAFS